MTGKLEETADSTIPPPAALELCPAITEMSLSYCRNARLWNQSQLLHRVLLSVAPRPHGIGKGKMLEFSEVSKSFWTGTQRKVILDRASFRVELGKSLGILAPNGTGKTTLINMMAGLEKPDEGTIRRECRISFPVGFTGGVNPRLSAMENCRYVARLYGLDPDYIEAFCRWLCDLKEYFDQPIGVYSSGMRARFTMSLTLALEFDMYLVDEGMPGAVDAEFNRKAGEILRQRMEKSTLVIVSHSPQTLERFVKTAAVLKNGQLHMFDSLEEARVLYDYQTDH
jgi:capsular polysaccharide transport system ATP-binding protein